MTLENLQKSTYTSGYKLDFQVSETNFVIRGKVNSFFHKQMIQEEAAKFIQVNGRQGLMQVQNEIEVVT